MTYKTPTLATSATVASRVQSSLKAGSCIDHGNASPESSDGAYEADE